MMLSTSLRYFDVNEKLETILLTSAASGDGKTTIAHDLAAATALAGRNVLLIEADLRRGDLATRLGLSRETGLSDVLAGHADWQDVCLPVWVSGPDDGSGGVHFDVVLAGMLPPNPTDLISSLRMRDVLVQAKERYQLVVIDTPPTPIVSDAIPLLSLVDGVLAVVRLGRTTRDAAHHLQRQLDRLGAPLLGLVINGVTRAMGYGYGDYPYRYEPSTPADSELTTLNGSAARHTADT
jgi:receptor protein-tyrosine kinase